MTTTKPRPTLRKLRSFARTYALYALASLLCYQIALHTLNRMQAAEARAEYEIYLLEQLVKNSETDD